MRHKLNARLIAGAVLVMGSVASAFAQMPGAPYIPYVKSTITLGQNILYFVASMYDTDYLPYTTPTAVATTGTKAADGTTESTTINVQGSITTTGVTVSIPATTTGSGILSAYSATITVPSNLTEDGISRSLTLSWAEQAYTIATTHITATLATVGGTLNAKKLDINGGIGSDNLGVLLGTFSYPYNSAGTTTTYQVRDIAAIPDKMFGKYDFGNTSTYEHNFLYVPVVGEDGKTWLNNNLGADYANVNKDSFNLVKQATSYDDYHAYGSLFQWGRKPDGHELMNWTTSEAGTAVYGSTSTLADEPANSLFITNTTNWRVNSVDNLWSTEASANNPCPLGYRVPTSDELSTLYTAAGITNYTTAFSSKLAFTATGDHKFDNVIEFRYQGNKFTNYWTSTAYGTHIYTYFLTSNSSYLNNTVRTYGFAVRCIGN
jgi:uncharacterized protein (TIGR02145 family)